MSKKKNPITKSDLCWIIVKLFGFLLVFFSIYSLIVRFSAWVMVDDSLSRSVEINGGWLFGVIFGYFLPLAIGIYLLTSGRILYDCLMSVPATSQPISASVSDSESEGIRPSGLTQTEQEAFDKWLEANPAMQKRDPSDQLALFRDAQEAGYS